MSAPGEVVTTVVWYSRLAGGTGAWPARGIRLAGGTP
ncbi:hypothetical protein SAMN05216368_11720 [Cryobacterium flavum]|uniref:Uncharacterized protein n=1 Tax=Cryobacterium flavum TaxID=1424659 RepID=A0A5E9G2U6_9MICO|nr:hypothetical protein SAMN05216368_11720 [Cryobacterium flavum]